MASLRIFRSLDEVRDDFKPSVLTIGNFDGVHVGHRQILRRVADLGRERGWKPSVLTFDPHPARIVAPARAPRLMTSPEQRAWLMKDDGIEQVLILPFDPSVAHLTSEEFVKSVLVERLGVKAVLVGDNFRFGHRHAADTKTLEKLGHRYGFFTEVIPGVRVRGHVVSSSAIRNLVAAGKVSVASRLLGRPYGLEGDVVPGHGVGSRQTVPTLNLSTKTEVLPAVGVYVTRTRDLDDSRGWPSVTNAGYRPTFDGREFTVETFLLSPLTGAAPRRIGVEFLYRLRAERKFESPQALKAQILRDAARALAYFRRWDRLAGAPL
jgi:riboflavin kinase/FMN adenylyltransferase